MASGAFEANLQCLPGLVASADLTGKNYLFVKEDSNGRVKVCDTAGEPPLGILQNQPGALYRAASVGFAGVSKCVAGAAIAKGQYVATGADGKAYPVTKSSTNTSDAGAASDALVGGFAIGRAFTPAVNAGDIISVLITHSGAVDTTAA